CASDAKVPPTSRLNKRWRNIFGNAGVNAAPELAVPGAVKKVNQQANREPNEESNPSQNWQAKHKREAEDHSDDRKHRYEWSAKRPRPPRVCAAQNDDADADKNEREQCPDVGQI